MAEPGDTITLTTDIELTEAWTPMGTKEAPFSATFDGNGYTISGLVIDTDNAAFFGYVADGAVIKNVTFEDVDVNGKYAAAVAYYAGAATIENVQVSGSVEATDDAAGIACYGAGTIKNCVNEATIKSEFIAAGIVAQIRDGDATIDGCENKGNVTGSAWGAGGICANFRGSITNCVNNGDVVSNGSMPAGGIIGVAKDATTIENCTNNGDVTNTGTNKYNCNAGGIMGHTPSTKYVTTINSCTNNGNITATTGAAAGIGVSMYSTKSIKMDNCVNNGEVQGGASAPGKVF